ncbi:hypothetical protein [Thalassospira marina]|uniref:DUF4404 domain-containing protein n=1 Tax=Thalassospira marina TaxID=2048283 RepID=A0ABN5FRC2_9PROT|nr:hypothetical protein [Thalassospira marina]AUG54204.1 hypothetical protein CSC3H3_16860 [Thalassospira marina]
MSDLTNMIAAAIEAFNTIDAKYQMADINTQAKLSDTRSQAATALVKLRDKQLEQDTSINEADIAEMNQLTAQIKDGAALQKDFADFLGILAKYVAV